MPIIPANSHESVAMEIAPFLKDEDYWTSDRTLAKMGLDNMSADDIDYYLQTGLRKDN